MSGRCGSNQCCFYMGEDMQKLQLTLQILCIIFSCITLAWYALYLVVDPLTLSSFKDAKEFQLVPVFLLPIALVLAVTVCSLIFQQNRLCGPLTTLAPLTYTSGAVGKETFSHIVQNAERNQIEVTRARQAVTAFLSNSVHSVMDTESNAEPNTEVTSAQTPFRADLTT